VAYQALASLHVDNWNFLKMLKNVIQVYMKFSVPIYIEYIQIKFSYIRILIKKVVFSSLFSLTENLLTLYECGLQIDHKKGQHRHLSFA
jgi:hypothetical protein